MLATAFSAVALMLAQPQTVWSGPPVEAFAMDGSRIAWISGNCRAVRARALAGGQTSILGNAKVTACDNRGTPMIALAGKRALWTVLTYGNFTYTYVFTRAVGERAKAKQVDYLVHQNDLDGDWLTAIGGEGTTLAYADLVVSGKTLTDGQDVYSADRGTVRRVVARARRIMRGTTPPYTIGVAAGRVALVPADRSESLGVRLRPELDGTVEVRDLIGNVVSRFSPQGRVRAVALTRSYVAALIAGRVMIYSLPEGKHVAMSVQVVGGSDIDASGTRVVTRSGRAIWVFDTTTGLARKVATASAIPIGLSISGRTVAWAENVRAGGRPTGRIRSLRV